MKVPSWSSPAIFKPFPSTQSTLVLTFFSLQPIKSERPVNMENLQVNNGNGQAYGYVLYETILPGEGQLNSSGHVRDRAQVKNIVELRLTAYPGGEEM